MHENVDSGPHLEDFGDAASDVDLHVDATDSHLKSCRWTEEEAMGNDAESVSCLLDLEVLGT